MDKWHGDYDLHLSDKNMDRKGIEIGEGSINSVDAVIWRFLPKAECLRSRLSGRNIYKNKYLTYSYWQASYQF